MKRSTKIVLLLTFVLLLVGVGAAAASDGTSGWESWWPKRRLTVEVAENGTRFLPDAEPMDADGMPLYGAEFITQGYLYPEGTLTCDGENNCNGVNPDGSPEFPDQVIGTWFCRGWHVNDAATTTAGPIVITTQTYIFGDDPTAQNLVTDGFEFADFNHVFERSITGGTGSYGKARGVQKQELLGWNPSVGTALRVTFELQR